MSYVNCPKCGMENIGGTSYCVKCGAGLRGIPAATPGPPPTETETSKCHKCGYVNPGNTKICMRCGDATTIDVSGSYGRETPRFCPYCGKPLEHGVVCPCRAAKALRYCTFCGRQIYEDETCACRLTAAALVERAPSVTARIPNTYDQRRTKSAGIILVALYLGIFSGILALIAGISMLAGSVIIERLQLWGIIVCILSIFSMAAAYGLWTLADWGRKIAIAIAIFDIASNFIPKPDILEMQNSTPIDIVVAAIDIVIIIYLLGGNIKKQFE